MPFITGLKTVPNFGGYLVHEESGVFIRSQKMMSGNTLTN
jgi:hypothetical protein